MESDSDGKIHVDGDKLLKFIDAVKSIGDMLEKLNILEVKEAFILGRENQQVERVIKLQELWQKTIHGIADMMKEDSVLISKTRDDARDMVVLVKSLAGVGQTSQYKDTILSLKELVELCDRLSKHRESGLLELLLKLTK